MIDKSFLEYIDSALLQYEEYHKQEGVQKLEFSDFLSLIQIWKQEQMLEIMNEEKK